jgi:hypothetical protein
VKGANVKLPQQASDEFNYSIVDRVQVCFIPCDDEAKRMNDTGCGKVFFSSVPFCFDDQDIHFAFAE